MKKYIENTNKKYAQKFFYKVGPRGGISLIVLVITIIVIIILASAVIVSLVNNNPITSASEARIKSDVSNMQGVFTNAVSKVMAESQDVIEITAGPLNTVTSGEKSAVGNAVYKLSDGTNGEVIFDTLPNEGLKYYTGKRLPIYNKKTTWYVDEDGVISLEVGDKKYGEGQIVKSIKIVASVIPSEEYIKTKATVKVEISSEDEIASIQFGGKEIEVPERKEGKYEVEIEVTENGTYEIEVSGVNGATNKTVVEVNEIDVVNDEIKINSSVTLKDEFIKTIANIRAEIVYSKEVESIKINGESITVPNEVDGKYVVNKEVTENGEYKIEVRAKDGTVNSKVVQVNVIEKLSENIRIDATVSPKNGYTSADIVLAITYSGEITSIKIEGVSVAVPSKVDGKYNITKNVLENGEYKVEVKAKDGTINKLKVKVTQITEDMEIWNKADMESFRNKVNSGRTFVGKKATLKADINLGGSLSNQWTPINNFAGTFNGEKHTISGLYINNSLYYQGLFGENKGTINNVKVKGEITAAGYSGGIAGKNVKTINGCINEVRVTSNERSGGICGTNEENGVIQNSGNNGKIVATVYTAAGITAGNYGTATKVIGCYNTGEIVTPYSAGGICASSCNNSLIDSCYNTGNITTNGKDGSSHSSTGGITGMNYNNSTVQYCYNVGIVTAAYPYVAGIVGYNGNSSSGTQTVKNVYNVGIIKNGSVSASKNIGVSSSYVGYLIGRYGSLSGEYGNLSLSALNAWTAGDISYNLGSRFAVDTTNKNIGSPGSPILSWQLMW